MKAQKTNRKSPAVSVLVPVYNVAKYLRQCLESLHKQTLEDIEFICINDGSTDESREIIDEFLKLDCRFRLIDKPNSGYGDSMNRGLKEARGKYIGIVESDDWVEKDAFEELYRLAESSGAEITRADFFRHRAECDEKENAILPYETNRVINPRHHAWVFLMPAAIWTALYRRDFLEKNKIEFLPTPGASYQDTGFAFKVWAAARKVRLTTKAYLHYRIDNMSSSINQRGKIFCICKEYDGVEEFLTKRGDFDELAIIFWLSKGAAYYWNASRLQRKSLKLFLDRIAPEVQKANKDGILFVDYYKNSPIGKFLKYLASGKTAAAARVVRRDVRFIKKMEKRAQNSLRPNRAKALAVGELITQLTMQNEALEDQIKKIQSQIMEHSDGKN